MFSSSVTEKLLFYAVKLPHILTKFISLISNSSELVLCLLTLFGPIILLTAIISINMYLAVKPILHSLIPNVSYKTAFAQARREVCQLFILYARFYHGHRIVGFDNIPPEGGAVIVFYHGAIPVDYIILVAATLLEKDRIIMSIVDKHFIYMPGFEMLSAGMGCFAGGRQECVRQLRAGRLVGVAPGGGLEAQAGRADTYGLMWKRRSGFASVAMEAGVPIIPVFTENIRECVVNLQTGLTWWRRIYEWTRVPLTPLYGAFPVRLTTHVGEHIRSVEGETVEELRCRTVRAMEALIEKNQKLPGNVLRAVGERLMMEEVDNNHGMCDVKEEAQLSRFESLCLKDSERFSTGG